jgi:hypothetical protein
VSVLPPPFHPVELFGEVDRALYAVHAPHFPFAYELVRFFLFAVELLLVPRLLARLPIKTALIGGFAV